MNMPLLEVEHLGFCYEKDKRVFDDISFQFRKGMLYALMGGNGSGKTTILRCLSGILSRDAGSITIAGRSIESLSRQECARLMSVVPQEHTIIFPYLVSNMVIMGRAPYIGSFSNPSEKDKAIAQEAMHETGITHLSDKLYTKISGGERQLVLIARALAQNTPIMILDEPTNHLDFRNQIRVLSILKRLVRDKGLLAIIATHDPNHALNYADEVMILHQGRIISRGSPQEVINSRNIKQVYAVDVEEIRKENLIRGVMPALDHLSRGNFTS